MSDIGEIEQRGISIVLGTYNRKNFLKSTINSIRGEMESTTIPYEIIVVDGGSNDGTLPWLLSQRDIISVVQHNRGHWRGKEIQRRSWGYFMNLGFKVAQGKYICMLSDDCLVIPGAIVAGYNQFEKCLSKGEKIGAIAFFWRNWPEEERYFVQEFFGKINVNHGIYLHKAIKEVSYADQDTYNFYSGDVDIIFKLDSLGYASIPAESSYIEHFSHANPFLRMVNMDLMEDDVNRFIDKWKAVLPANVLTEENRCHQIEEDFIDKNNTVKIWKSQVGIIIYLTKLKIGSYIYRRPVQ